MSIYLHPILSLSLPSSVVGSQSVVHPRLAKIIHNYSLSFKCIFSLIFSFVFMASLNAQSTLQKAYLEEKVRDPYIREFIEKEMSGTATKQDLEAIQQYIDLRKNKTSGATMFSTGVNEFLEEGAEPHIVIHPTNKNLLALAFMQTSGSNADYPIYVSRNGGTTWTKSAFNSETALQTVFPGGTVLGGGDPILAFDEDGTLHFTYIYIHGTFPTLLRGDMLYVYSLDTGNTFIVPPLADHIVYAGNLVASDLLDRQWMAVDNSGGPFDGNLYLSAFYFGGALNTIGQLVLTKEANSSNFDLNNLTTAVVPPAGDLTQFGNIQVDQTGRIHLTCAVADQLDGSGSVVHTISIDGGQTFGTPTQVGTGDVLFPQNGLLPNSIIHDRENAAISLAVDRNNVYVAWTDLGNDSCKAYFSYSHDAGANFSQQLEFGNLLLGSSAYHFFPNVAADSGRVTISWYTVDKFSRVTNYYMAESSDSGTSFDAVIQVSDTSSAFVGGANAFYGDYNSSVKHGCETFSVWSDGRSGTPGIYVARTQLSDTTGIPWTSITELTPVTEDFQVGNLWPNPSDKIAHFMVSLTESQGVYSELYDINGRWIKRIDHGRCDKGQCELSVNIAELASGRYLLKINSSNSSLFATRILLKQ